MKCFWTPNRIFLNRLFWSPALGEAAHIADHATVVQRGRRMERGASADRQAERGRELGARVAPVEGHLAEAREFGV